MSNYTKLTDFASKDALPSGNAGKIVKGTEIDDEFVAISTAVATKADTASPTLTGTPVAPTAATGTDTTQISTTAFVQQELEAYDPTPSAETLVNALYPVGSIYINATNSTNPGTLLGHGTWTAFGAGRVPVGIDSSDTDFDTAEETGGAKTHTLTLAEMPAHAHTYTRKQNVSIGTVDTGSPGDGDPTGGGPDFDVATVTAAAGSGSAHNNLQPYIVVYMWKRTA